MSLGAPAQNSPCWFGVQGLGLRVWGLGFRCWALPEAQNFG